MAPASYSPSAALHSPGDYESSSSSSSPSSGFWQRHSVRHLGRKMKRAAHALTHGPEEKHVVYIPDSKLSGKRNIDDRCDTLPIDDLDQLDTMVTEHEYRQHRLSADQPRRHSVLEMLEPVLLEWRRSVSSSFSSSARDLSSSSKASKVSKPTDTESATAVSVRSSETGRYTIDLDMFDTFTYISTPVLGGDNYSNHEHREPSNLSSTSSEMKQAS
eukprot:jgi/Phyca11/508904/fgenesh2_kg.PHYCAscaffold_39_\